MSAMNEHNRHQRQQERQQDKDGIILGIYDSLEDREPDISTERLLAQTADAAHCSIDRVISALKRNRSTQSQPPPTK